MTAEAPWTIGRLLTWTADYLGQNGSESLRLDAESLLAHARECQRIELYTAFDEPAPDVLRTAFRELVRRRAEGTPVAYLVGRKEFYSLSFRVTPDVLIPRPETELVVVTLLDRVKESRTASGEKEITIADVGTGSGILAICAARHIPNSRVTALDISPSALEVARSNAAEHQVADRIELLESDLFAAVEPKRRFDFIISNPPYVSNQEMEELPTDVRDYEPHGALLAGERGTEVIERLAEEAIERLAPGGWLLVELSPMIAQAVERLFDGREQWERRPTIKDLANLPRVLQVRRTGNE